MERKNVLVTLPVNQEQKDLMLEQASGGLFECDIVFCENPGKKEALAADAVIGGIKRELLSGNDRVEWIQLASAGADKYCSSPFVRKEAVITNASGAYGTTVSEHMIALTFSLIRKLEMYRDNQLSRIWKAEGMVTSVEGSTVLVMGLGDIGGAYARKMRALGARIIGIRRNKDIRPEYTDAVFSLEDLPEIIGSADIIAMVLPDTGKTEHVITKEVLDRVKPGAYLVNAGRGTAVDQDALAEALENGKLAGAALDVTDPEPLPADSPLWGMRNVIITPHVAGNFSLKQTLEKVVGISVSNLHCWTHGLPLAHVVNRKKGY
ncbi:MAG: D-2-hydroxyacid dehydrogenase [Oscillospiraceae bacterium]